RAGIRHHRRRPTTAGAVPQVTGPEKNEQSCGRLGRWLSCFSRSTSRKQPRRSGRGTEGRIGQWLVCRTSFRHSRRDEGEGEGDQGYESCHRLAPALGVLLKFSDVRAIVVDISARTSHARPLPIVPQTESAAKNSPR